MEVYLLSSAAVGAATGWRIWGSRKADGKMETKIHEVAVLDCWDCDFAAAA